MKRTTILLPDDLERAVDSERHRLGVSTTEVVRRALTAYLESPSTPRLSFIGIGRSGERHTARDIDQILAEEWVNPKGKHAPGDRR